MDKTYGATIERGEILTAAAGKYTVKSLDRDGIESPPIEAIHDDLEYESGDKVYFFLYKDGTGKIICPL